MHKNLYLCKQLHFLCLYCLFLVLVTPTMARNERDQWNNMLKRLQAYQQGHNGSCNVPKGYRQDPQLAAWVKNQHSRHKKGLLAMERCDQLEAIGFEWKKKVQQSLPYQWTNTLKRLQAYQKEHNGSCSVPRHYPQDPQLGKWVHKQRYYYTKGLLEKERFDQLEKIGFEWKFNCTRASTQLQPPLSKVSKSKSKEPDTREPVRWCVI